MKQKTATEICRLLAHVITLFLTGLFIWQLWNHLLTTIVPVREIGYWEALGLKILFGSLFPGIQCVRVINFDDARS